MVNETNNYDNLYELGDEIELTEDSDCVNLLSKTKYIGSVKKDDASSLTLFGDTFSLDYSDDESTIVSMLDMENADWPRMLMIDEIDICQVKNLARNHFIRSSEKSEHPNEEKEDSRSLTSENVVNSSKEPIPSPSFHYSIWKIYEENTTTRYEVKQSVVQGWLYKKGTGNDIFRSRYWKPRWCNLALASIDGYEIDVPILLVSWHPSMPVQSNVIILDSATVTIDIKNERSDQPELFCFDIACAKNEVTNAIESRIVTRSFGAPLEEREEWVREIKTTLLDYKKKKLNFRKQNSRRIMDCDGYL